MNALGAFAGLAVLASLVSLRLAMAARYRAAVSARLAPHADRPGWVAPVWFARRWEAALLPLDATGAWRSCLLGVGGASSLLALAAGLRAALVVATCLVAGGFLLLHLRQDRADAAVAAAMPTLLDAVARSLRSGATVPGALGEAAPVVRGPLASDLRQVAEAIGAGVGMDDALARWAARRLVGPVRLTVDALGLARDAGGPAARVVDALAAGLRADAAVAAEAAALASQAKLSGLVIALAPLGFGILAGLTDGRTASFLLGTSPGLACLVGGLALDAAAVVWMGRIVTAQS